MIVLPKFALSVISTLKAKGFLAFAVGGSVRDLLLGKSTKGWDFTTNATPEEILSLFPDSFYDNTFGTVGIKIHSEKNPDEVTDIYEITTFRSESGYTDHRHPGILTWGKSLEEDLSRRDFTINAIATNGTRLIDPYEGAKDLENHLIRAVGNADDRFKEDALRMMRAVRIASQIGMIIEDKTLDAIKKHAPLINKISSERIRDELLKLVDSEFAADGILILKNSTLLHFILPELEVAFEYGQKSPKRHHIFDVGTHSVMALKNCPSNDTITKLATLLHDIGKPQTRRVDEKGIVTFFNHEVVGAGIAKRVAYRLRLSKKQTDKLITLIRWHQFSVDERQTDSAIRRFIRRATVEFLPDMLALRIGDRLGGGALETSWRLELYKKRLEEVQKQPFSVSDLKISGHDVMEILSIRPGPMVGKILSELFTKVEAGTLTNDREVLIREISSQL
ncbi:HD domain-containing protein [Candidatus Gottesmanbacteria bacterium]|nr:HD domain-containing protein [Candidatus Gottesmanbacteria bacterium]